MKKLKISFEEEKKDKFKCKYKNYPRIDQNLMAFGSEEEVEAAKIDYIRKIKCDMPGCNSGKSLNSYYCIRHSN